MKMFIVSVCLALVAAAPPIVPVDGSAVDDTSTATMPAVDYLDDEVEYFEAPLPMVPVLLLTPQEFEGLLGDMEYRYGEDVVLEEQEDDHMQDKEHVTEVGGVSRIKRQVSQEALNIALSHRDRNGNPRPVGRPHGRLDLNGVYKDRNNHHTQGGIGLGSVVYRSNNGRHSVGVGAYGTQGRGRYYGYGYKSQPQWGAGIGYRFRF